jgi:hypothetical protein
MTGALVALGLLWAQHVAPPVSFTVAASGDFLIHGPVAARALADGGGSRYDFRPMFGSIRARVEGADLALCHVETPLVPGPARGYPSFRTPPALAGAIRDTGWDACSTASNHSLDAGQYGVRTTLEALDRAGVPHSGTARSARGGGGAGRRARGGGAGEGAPGAPGRPPPGGRAGAPPGGRPPPRGAGPPPRPVGRTCC